MTSIEEAEGTLPRRALWLLIDQAANSMYSLVVGVVAARTLTVVEFGVFSAVFTAYLLSRDLLRSLVTDPLIIGHSGIDTMRQRGRVQTSMLLAGSGAGAVTGAALVVAGRSGETALAVGLAIVLLIAGDAMRGVNLSLGRPARAATLSFGLLVGLVLLATLVARLDVGLDGIMLVVAGSGLVAVLLVSGDFRPSLDIRASVTWVIDRLHLGTPLALDFLLSAGITYVALLVLAALDPVDAAGFRGAQMIAAPVALLFVVAAQLIITEESRRANSNTPLGWALAGPVLVGMMLVSLAYCLPVWAARGSVAQILDDSADASLAVLGPTLFFAVTTAPSLAASALLRAHGAVTSALRARVVSSVLVAPLLVGGVVLSGASAAMTLGALAQLATIPIWTRAVNAARGQTR